MVTGANRTSRPLTGWVQVFSARARRAALSYPRAGGELNSEPTTEKRKRAHKAEVDRSGCWVINVSSQRGWKRHCDQLERGPPDRRRASSAGRAELARNLDRQPPGERGCADRRRTAWKAPAPAVARVLVAWPRPR